MFSAIRKTPRPNGEEATLLAPDLPVYQFTVKQYHRMIDANILDKYDRVELLEGQIVPKTTHKPPHDASVSFVQTEFTARIPDNWIVRIQSAITTVASEPEPDIAVVKGPARRYVRSHPRPSDIGLLVEVAEVTLTEDRFWKGRLYARARIPVYWIVNLVERIVEVYTQPKGGKVPGYRARRDYAAHESIPLIIAGRVVGLIRVRDLLP